jgi:hypothetical protein
MKYGLLVALALLGRPAMAQRVAVQADGTVNVGYNQTTQTTAVVDANAAPGDVATSSSTSLFTEIRPGISVQSGSPRVSWRASYLFSGTLNLEGGAPAYSNQATGALAAELTPLTTLTVGTTFAQGGTLFLLSQKPAETGTPEIRAPGNPNRISATLSESIAWQAGRHLQVQHSLAAALSAPQDDPGNGNTALTATASIERPYERDNVGAEFRASVSSLSPLREDLGRYLSYTSAVLARWNHDFTPRWNGFATAGIEQLFTDTGNRPLAFLPAGSASLRYSAQHAGGALEFRHGTATNLQVGSVSLSDQLTARGVITLDERKLRVLSFSAGFLHNEPFGEAAVQVAAGTGNAIQGDASLTTAMTNNILATARYSLAYQYGQDSGLEQDPNGAQSGAVGPTLAHIFFVGVTASYSNTKQIKRPIPTRGQRVDGADNEGFLVVPDAGTTDGDAPDDNRQPK